MSSQAVSTLSEMTSENPDLTLRFESQNIPHRHQGLCPYHTKPPIPPQLTSMPMRQGVYAPQAEPRILKAPPHCQRRSQLLNASLLLPLQPLSPMISQKLL